MGGSALLEDSTQVSAGLIRLWRNCHRVRLSTQLWLMADRCKRALACQASPVREFPKALEQLIEPSLLESSLCKQGLCVHLEE